MGRKQPERTWTDADQALLYTCHLAADVLAGRRPTGRAVLDASRPRGHLNVALDGDVAGRLPRTDVPLLHKPDPGVADATEPARDDARP